MREEEGRGLEDENENANRCATYIVARAEKGDNLWAGKSWGKKLLTNL